MNPIRLPVGIVLIEQIGGADAVDIRQTREGAVVTAAGPRHFARVVAPPMPGVDAPPAGPLVIDARALVQAAAAVGCSMAVAPAGRPLMVVPINAEIVGIVGPAGTPQTIPTSGSAVADCSGMIDTIQGEAASGMTKQVAVIETEYLGKLATVAIAMGITAVEVTIALRWDALLAEGRMPDGSEASFGITGIVGPATIATHRPVVVEPMTEPEGDADPLTFFVPDPKARRGGNGRKSKPDASRANLTDLPF